MNFKLSLLALLFCCQVYAGRGALNIREMRKTLLKAACKPKNQRDLNFLPKVDEEVLKPSVSTPLPPLTPSNLLSPLQALGVAALVTVVCKGYDRIKGHKNQKINHRS